MHEDNRVTVRELLRDRELHVHLAHEPRGVVSRAIVSPHEEVAHFLNHQGWALGCRVLGTQSLRSLRRQGGQQGRGHPAQPSETPPALSHGTSWPRVEAVDTRNTIA